ncbi:MAG: ABC transporter permease [Bacteroidia bacterium]
MRFLIKRILQGILVLWGIVSILFLIFYTLGDPIEYLVDEGADEATKTAIRARYGLDKSLLVQYATYINDLSPIGFYETDSGESFGIKSPSLGTSYQTNRGVAGLIANRLSGTAILAGASLIFAAILGLILGVIASLYKDKWPDRLILGGSVLGISAPSFFVGVLVVWLFSVKWGSSTGLHATGFIFEEKLFGEGYNIVWKNLLLPALALGIRPLAVFVQLTRSSMLDVLSQDYIRTAHAKGLAPKIVLIRHAFRNALSPVMTSATGWLASLLAGAFFIEYIFNWQGIGQLTIEALNTKDFPVILGCALFIGLIFVLVSIVTDAMYKVLDPRVEL